MAILSLSNTLHRYLLHSTQSNCNCKQPSSILSGHTLTHTQLFYGSLDFIQDNLDEPVPEETFTHSHLSWSSIISYLLHPSATIHGILPVQSECLTVFFHNLSPSFLLSTSWLSTFHSYSIHFFTHSLSSFHNTRPYHRNLFCRGTEIMLSNPSLSLKPLLGTLSCSFTPHTHLTILISAHRSATSLSFLTSSDGRF